MNHFTSILLPLDGSPEAAKGADCALWLAEKLGATLHVLHATPRPLPVSEELARLHIPATQHTRVVVHQLAENAVAAVLEAIETHHVELVVMSAHGKSASMEDELSKRMGMVAQAVIEKCPVPVLLLPKFYREILPWTSMLVAASGEASADRALETAARLASALKLNLTVVHAEDGPARKEVAPLGAYADAPHYEYPQRLEGMVERGLARCTMEEAHCCVHKVLLRRGETASVLLQQAARHHSSVLALGWNGALGAGRAPVLKRLLEEAECALLIVRSRESPAARLKVGREIDEG